MPDPLTAEQARLEQDGPRWKTWGPYLADRAWGTVREDYSADGSAWTYFPHDHARSRAYRWNEDGLAGICDDRQRLCFALALWNGCDPILKERLFGLAGPEGNHGEDVKECYFHLDSTPTHSYMKMLYKYPQAAFPYEDLVRTNAARGKDQPEYELVDTGVFAEQRYFDVVVEYAKADADDVLIRITATNRGPEPAPLHLLPTLWFRNTWSWGREQDDSYVKPSLAAGPDGDHTVSVIADHYSLGRHGLTCAAVDGDDPPPLLFTENDTNTARLFNTRNASPFVKDGIGSAVIDGVVAAVNPRQEGTKVAAHYRLALEPGASAVVRLRLRAGPPGEDAAFADFDALFARRLADADAFYDALHPAAASADERLIQRQALAGLLWSKQFYHFNVAEWLDPPPDNPPVDPARRAGRNRDWRHLHAHDVISMPDKWEYPWFAAWDLAFHAVPLALVDPDFAKEQLVLLGREWYQHPNGQISAYEWAFGDVNPPVLAWAVRRVYELDKARRGAGDRHFLQFMFHKLALNFTWWVNRKDALGNNVFQGGFLGLDNIGVFDRSASLPTGGFIEQSDGTSWMAMFCLDLLWAAMELSQDESVYLEIASKYAFHLLYIVAAMDNMAGQDVHLWDPQDEFFYDVLHTAAGARVPLKVRSMVGLIPLLAVLVMDEPVGRRAPELSSRLAWFVRHRPALAEVVTRWRYPGVEDRRLISLCRRERLQAILKRMLDAGEFLSPFGVRALSRCHADQPYEFHVNGEVHTVRYEPGESTSGMFGGNSNWRGPVWMPVNYLLVEALRRYGRYYGETLTVELPAGAGRQVTLDEAADDLARRLIALFARGPDGRRPVLGDVDLFQSDPHWRDCIPFYEYFHGDSGRGCGASHQTGWTGLVAMLIHELHARRPAET